METETKEAETKDVKKIVDITMMCKIETPPHPVSINNTELSFKCPHCGTEVTADLPKMKIDDPKHDLRQITEKRTLVSAP